MIVNIDYDYVRGISGQRLSDQCSMIISNGHYIDCDGVTRETISNAINGFGSKTQKDMFRCYKGFDITQEFRMYLTTIDVKEFALSLEPLLQEPSELLVENSVYEWEVYKYLPEVYKHDPQFKNLFALLSKSISDKRLTCLHGGGHTQYGQIIEQKNRERYRGVYKWKCCAIFDRDTEDDASFDIQKNHHFVFFCGKNYDAVSMDDVYSLSQRDGWIWHMWYKRAIENYFPKERYEELGIPVGDDGISDYTNIGSDYKSCGYKKDLLPKLAKGMSRTMYEQNLKRFVVNGVGMSEMQLLLLKIVKIV